MKERRLGQFQIDRYLIDNRPETAREILANTIVVRAEFLYTSDSINYVAIHPDFALVSQDETIPVYRALLEKKERKGRQGEPDTIMVDIFFTGFEKVKS